MAVFGSTVTGGDNVALVIRPALELTPLEQLFTVVEGVKAKTKVTVLGTTGKITKADGGCGVGAIVSTLPTTNYVWDPHEMKSWLTFCNKNDRASLLATGLSLGFEAKDVNTAVVAVTDGTGTAPQNQMVGEILLAISNQASAEDMLRQSIFGDTAMTLTSETVPGVLWEDLDIADYTAYDGMLKQVFAIVSADATRRYTITQNGLTTYALQDALTAGQSKTIFQALRKGASPRLKRQGDIRFVVSQSIWDNWVEYRESVGIETSFQKQVDGRTEASFNGWPIVVLPEYDQWIQSDFINGTKYTLPRHFAMLYSLSFNQLGVDTSDEAMKTKVFFDDTTDLLHIKSEYAVDVKVPFADMIQVAY